jgi:hypothetical protein
VRGYRYAVVPNTWINRKQGVSKFPPLRGRHARRAQPAGASSCLTIILTKIPASRRVRRCRNLAGKRGNANRHRPNR